LNNERIPNQDLIFIRTLPALEAPCQQVLVRASLERLGSQLVVVHVPEPAKAGIETRGIGKSQMITIRQEALGVQADFVQHAGEKVDPGCLHVVATEGLIGHVVSLLSKSARGG